MDEVDMECGGDTIRYVDENVLWIGGDGDTILE